ncbi:hypothetical protein OIE53_09410 [Micromonospora sp. NBC_01739]|nr:hypothetical protein OIE53_09410 [Micromonospora sp. NBC_01739]
MSELDEAYQRVRLSGPERNGWLSNHAPMAVEAMARHGHGEALHRWLDGYADRLEDRPRGIAPIAADRSVYAVDLRGHGDSAIRIHAGATSSPDHRTYLLIGGGPSSPVSQQHVAELPDRLADARLVTITAGHLVHETAPAAASTRCHIPRCVGAATKVAWTFGATAPAGDSPTHLREPAER